jgi:hypothetical protein
MIEEPGEASQVTADPVMGDLRIRWFTCSWPLTPAVMAERPMPAQGPPGFVSLTSGTSGPSARPGVLVRSACGGVGVADGSWWEAGVR